MFELSDNYEVDRKILKYDYIRCSLAGTSTIITPNSHKGINIPREGYVLSMLNRFLDFNFEVMKTAGDSRFANGDDRWLVTSGPIALFSIFKLTTSSGKHIKDINHPHIVSLLLKLKPSTKYTDDLSFGFDRDRKKRQQELTNNKFIKTIIHVRIKLEDVFGFAEYQAKGTYALGYKLTLTRNKEDALLHKAVAFADAGNKNDNNHWCVPHYTPSIQ